MATRQDPAIGNNSKSWREKKNLLEDIGNQSRQPRLEGLKSQREGESTGVSLCSPMLFFPVGYLPIYSIGNRVERKSVAQKSLTGLRRRQLECSTARN